MAAFGGIREITDDRGISDDAQQNGVSAMTGGTKPPSSRSRGGGPYERVTVNLAPHTSAALERAAEMTGDTKTDTINRALQLYAMLVEVVADGGAVYIREKPGDELERQRFFLTTNANT
jgi:hypothetical protein